MKTIKKAAEEYALKTGFHSDRETFIAGVKWAQRWIPVKEELPEIGELVLICANKGLSNEYISVDRRVSDINWAFYYYPQPYAPLVTHWRRIELKY